MDLRLCLSSSSFSHHSNKYHYKRTIKTPGSYTHASQNTVQFPQFTRYLQRFHEDTVNANPSLHDELSKEFTLKTRQTLVGEYFSVYIAPSKGFPWY